MYVWSKEIETGHGTIDSQHKEWFGALNSLLEACSQGKGRDTIRSTLIFLNDYTAKHFSDEEALQRKCSYPEYSLHKQYHETFKRVVRDIITEYDKDGPSVALVGKINGSLGTWFINHIKKEDVKLAAYIKNLYSQAFDQGMEV